jgi:hypothetical protein
VIKLKRINNGKEQNCNCPARLVSLRYVKMQRAHPENNKPGYPSQFDTMSWIIRV